MTKLNTTLFSLTLLSTLAMASVVSAQRGQRRGPPPQAIEACANQAADAACSFEGRRGDVEGVCTERRHGDGLVCRPNHRRGRRGDGQRGEARRGHRRGPPEQALQACADQAANSQCTFEGRRGQNVEGMCIARRNGEGLVCRRPPPEQAVQACANQSAEATCSFEGRRGQSVEGMCKASRHSEGLVCRPNRGRHHHGRRGHRPGPPEQAITACANQSANATCSFEGRRGQSVEGMCIERRHGDGLVCRPERQNHRSGI